MVTHCFQPRISLNPCSRFYFGDEIPIVIFPFLEFTAAISALVIANFAAPRYFIDCRFTVRTIDEATHSFQPLVSPNRFQEVVQLLIVALPYHGVYSRTD
jgi:hypothetical protein